MISGAQTRTWRGWLFASIPVLFVYGPLVVHAVLESLGDPVYAPGSGMQFTPVEVEFHVPLSTRIAFLWPLVTAIVLARLFFRWGKHRRPVPKRSLVLAALPWLVGSLNLVLQWRYGVLWEFAAVGSGGVGMAAAGLAESLGIQAATAAGSTLLLASLLAVLALETAEVRGVRGDGGPVMPQPRRTRLLVVSMAALSLVSAQCACLAAHAGQGFFEGIAQTDLAEWHVGLDASAGRWATLHGAQLFTAGAALLGYVACFAWRGTLMLARGGLSTLGLAGTLLLFTHGAHLMTERWVLAGFAHVAGAAREGASPSSLRTLGVDAVDHALKPALSLTASGIHVSGALVAPWVAGSAHVERVLAEYRQRHVIEGEDAMWSLPVSLTVGLEESATLASLICLSQSATHIGLNQLALATGPEQEIPPATRDALARVSPALGSAFFRRVSVTPLHLAKARCRDSDAKHVWSADLGPTATLERDVQQHLGHPSYEDCIDLRLERDASLDDLFRLLRGGGHNAQIAFAPEAAQACSSSRSP